MSTWQASNGDKWDDIDEAWARHNNVNTEKPSGDEMIDEIRAARRARLRRGEGSGHRLLEEFEHEQKKIQGG